MDVKINAQRKPIQATLHQIPGDKSISHRAIIVGSLADNTSIFTHFLCAQDCLNTIAIFQSMGVPITVDVSTQTVRIQGVGLRGLQAPEGLLDCGNSGTSIRLIAGVLASQPFGSVISGDDSIQRRPMNRIVTPLSTMGARITGKISPTDTYPPLRIDATQTLTPIRYVLPMASAQVKSSILFASLACDQRTELIEQSPSRDHTERMLKGFGADIVVQKKSIFCSGKSPLHNPSQAPIHIPADVSSAAFFIVLGCVLPNTSIRLTGIGLNPTRTGLLTFLKNMGADITIENQQGLDFEPYGDIVVKSSSLVNASLQYSDIPFLIDEIPILAIASLFAIGTCRVNNIEELRVKESDRIGAISTLVRAMGGTCREYHDGFEIDGMTPLKSFEIDSKKDHRIAMTAIIGALCAGVDATIHDCDCIQTSFPNFIDCLLQLGFDITT